jgi:hypothetical protein
VADAQPHGHYLRTENDQISAVNNPQILRWSIAADAKRILNSCWYTTDRGDTYTG